MIDSFMLKNGVVQYTYWHNESNSPLGVLWAMFAKGDNGKKIAFVLNAMTAPWARRKGICTELHKEVEKNSDIILTPNGTAEGGKNFLEKYGFIHNIEIDMWVYTKGEYHGVDCGCDR